MGDDRLKPFVLRYFLADDTIQINDGQFESNQKRGLYASNRPEEAVFVRRQKILKGLPSLFASLQSNFNGYCEQYARK